MEFGCKNRPFNGWNSEIPFTLKESNVKIQKYIVGISILSGLICLDASIIIKGTQCIHEDNGNVSKDKLYTFGVSASITINRGGVVEVWQECQNFKG